MSKNPRDAQFQGFAKALWDELVQANGYGYIDVNEDDDGIDPTNYRQIMARRAYDLVCHVWEEMLSSYDGTALEDIPDMTELPKEQE